MPKASINALYSSQLRENSNRPISDITMAARTKPEQRVLEVSEVFQCPAGNVVRQKNFDEQVERLAQRVGERGFAQQSRLVSRRLAANSLSGQVRPKGSVSARLRKRKNAGSNTHNDSRRIWLRSKK